MAVDSRAKGARAEADVRDLLRKSTGLQWERVPGSGALNEKHGLKGDLYCPNERNLFCVEVKHYEEDHLTSEILTSKNPTLLDWWKQATRQALQVNKKPLLIFKHNRSKKFVAYTEIPSSEIDHVFIQRDEHSFYVSELEDWLKKENPKFIA